MARLQQDSDKDKTDKIKNTDEKVLRYKRITYNNVIFEIAYLCNLAF